MELEIAGGGVSCTTVHPGGIKTNIARNARMRDDTSGTEPADDFDKHRHDDAREGGPPDPRRRVASDRRRVLIGPDAKVLDLVTRLPRRLPAPGDPHWRGSALAGRRRGR